MRNYWKILAWCLVVAQSISCREDGMVGEAKFITFHGLKMQEMPAWYLIHVVDQAEWTIHYGFSDNSFCSTSGVGDTSAFEQQLKDSVEKVLLLWLQPLREQFDNIVDTFVMENRDTVPVTEENKLPFSLGAKQQIPLDQDAPAHLRITFHCMQREGKGQYPRPFVEMRTSPQVHMFHFRSKAEEGKEENACGEGGECDQSEIFHNDKMSSEHMFMITTMVHEIGHAFGLGDVYIEPEGNSPSKRDSINYSTGGSERTVGKQPHSVMGVANIVALSDDGEPMITPDDEEAIKWLYLQSHQRAPLDACPSDYIEEKETNGCLPRFPLILAVRKGDYEAVEKLLEEDDTIDIDSCDRYGNTALSYAQQGKDGHGTKMVTLLKDDFGANPSVTCTPVPQEQVERDENLPLTTADATQAAATAEGNKLDQLKEKISCSTLAHARPATNTLLLLLLLLPVLGNCLYRRPSKQACT